MAYSSIDISNLPESKKHKIATRSDLEKRTGIQESIREFFEYKGMGEPNFIKDKGLVISKRRKGSGQL